MVVTIMTGTMLGTGKVGGGSLVYKLIISRHRTGDFNGNEGDDGDCDSDNGVSDDDDDVVRLTIITTVMP